MLGARGQNSTEFEEILHKFKFFLEFLRMENYKDKIHKIKTTGDQSDKIGK